MCQTRISVENASPHSTAEVTAMTKSCVTSNRLRFSASPTTPAIVPMNSIGRLRATVTRATITVDWVDLIREDRGNQQLKPAHRIADSAGKPQA
jgi:hypothetical protein